jgi:hypothetical protein
MRGDTIGRCNQLGAGGGKSREGRYPHGPGGPRQFGRPGEAAWATTGFGPGANENIETLFYLVWILFKRY